MDELSYPAEVVKKWNEDWKADQEQIKELKQKLETLKGLTRDALTSIFAAKDGDGSMVVKSTTGFIFKAAVEFGFAEPLPDGSIGLKPPTEWDK